MAHAIEETAGMRRNGRGAPFGEHDHIVIVGASLAGLKAAETLRAEDSAGV